MENVPVLPSNNQVMSSREMAELTEKRHDSVKRTIETLAQNGVISSPQSVNFKNINNVEGIEYLVCKRDSYVIVAQLSPEFTARLVDRWQKLEEKVTTANPQISAMIFALQSLDAVQQQQKAHAEELALHVAALDSHSERIASIEAKSSAIISQHEFYSVLGYSKLHGIKVDVKKASHYGKLATAESKRHGVMTGTVPDPRFGTVKTYHTDILDIVFGK